MSKIKLSSNLTGCLRDFLTPNSISFNRLSSSVPPAPSAKGICQETASYISPEQCHATLHSVLIEL